MNADNAKAQMRKGVLEYCILAILANQDAYASDIIQMLKDSDLMVVEGTLYPLLMRLKNTGYLKYRWEESLQGPPRKYYDITEEGRKFLKELDKSWEDLVSTVNAIREKHR